MAFDDLIGIPFAYGGRSLAGLDCWGLVVEVYRRLGIAVEDVAEYHDVLATAANPVFETQRTAAWRQVGEPFEPHDVLLFSGGCCGAATHCAIWIGDGQVLHTREKTGVIVSPFRLLRSRFLGAYRRAEVPCPA